LDGEDNVILTAWANSNANVIAKRWRVKKATIGLIAAAAILVSGH